MRARSIASTFLLALTPMLGQESCYRSRSRILLEARQIANRLKDFVPGQFFRIAISLLDCQIKIAQRFRAVPGKGIHSSKIVIMIRISRFSLNGPECPGDRIRDLSGHGQSQVRNSQAAMANPDSFSCRL